VIITDNSFRWSEICSSIPYYYGFINNPWAKFESFVSNYPVQFPFIIEQKTHMQELKKSEFMAVKKVLKRLWNSINTDKAPNDSQIDHLQNEFVRAQEVMSKSIEKLVQKGTETNGISTYTSPINIDSKINCKISPIGHINNLVYRLLVSYSGHDKYLKSLPLSLYVEYVDKERV
jgi:hypothetical protein